MKKIASISLVGIGLFFASWQQQGIKEKLDRGKKVYNKVCLTCHMVDGMGVPRMNPALAKSRLVGGSKTKLIKIVLRGSDELQNDPDRNYKNIMASHADLTDQQISDVLTFIRNTFGNKAAAVTPGDVKFVRAKTIIKK